MSEYYNSQRTKGLYESGLTEPFKISRSKIDLFLQCPRCFYLDRKLGVARPPGFPFSLNSAVDALQSLAVKTEILKTKAGGRLPE